MKPHNYIVYIYMSEFADVFDTLIVSGLEGAGMILLLVISYKLYKMRIRTHSNCCDGNVDVMTDNPGVAGEENV